MTTSGVSVSNMCRTSSGIEPLADSLPLRQVLFDPTGCDIKQGQATRRQMNIVLRVAQVAEHRQTQGSHKFAQFVGGNGARVDPHADQADLQLVMVLVL